MQKHRAGSTVEVFYKAVEQQSLPIQYVEYIRKLFYIFVEGNKFKENKECLMFFFTSNSVI